MARHYQLVGYLLVGILFLLWSCQNLDQYRQPISELQTKWEQTTLALLELPDSLQQTQARVTALSEQLDSNTINQPLSEIQAEVITLSQEVDAFINRWQEQQSQVDALVKGWREGRLPKAPEASIGALEQIISSARMSLTTWSATNRSLRERLAGIEASLADSVR